VAEPLTGTDARVLVVEDDDAVRDALGRGLGLHGFAVECVPDAERALVSLTRHPPHIVVLDIGLPGMSGIDLCTQVRTGGVDLPILVLSARDQVHDRVAGLEAGADDYLVKPFDLTELVLRLRALLRRAPSEPVPASAVVAGPLWIDEARRIAMLAGSRLELSRREFDLLAMFAAHPGIVLSRTQLLERVWGYDFEVDTNVVDVFVGYLRRKCEAIGGGRLIETVRGVGYVLRVA
jgi:two-component system response regulator PrrA